MMPFQAMHLSNESQLAAIIIKNKQTEAAFSTKTYYFKLFNENCSQPLVKNNKNTAVQLLLYKTRGRCCIFTQNLLISNRHE